ncbi:hypothetical protein DU68_01480 [Methanosarcina mazei]|uniref:Glycosyl transferase family 1 domain-containing protein n=1 Tax=Methanosarcina mazei TaxID=2209 RepID=A0A0F8K8U5_METMZ|nr:glycosyltransferase family 4 protein [Methanosarcina mazei]KKG99372.1 hypothetical protein DU56_04715 [Methanosarcina mazei]KKH00365.1 hypothetical protein DU66_09390 [Methanosarcina mazei]KKH02834.1 hypothetical protein DU68_01480 [Methanosarcina mazei]
MEKYKIAFIHNIISPYRIPLFEGLSGHPSLDLFVYFCAKTHKNRKWDVLENKNYKYEVLSGILFESFGITFHINPSIFLRLFKEKYDAVIISGNPDFTTFISYLTCRLFNIPIIWWSEGIESAQSFLGKLISPIIKHIVKNVDSVVVPGSLSRDFQVKMGSSYDKIFLAPNIVDNDTYIGKSLELKKNKAESKQKLELNYSTIILYVGQLIERKGVDYLISAYQILKDEFEDLCLVIIGDGDFKNNLESICNRNDINDVYFKGWVSEEEKFIYYSISDVFVLPTLSDVWGLVINEAMCFGLPVVSTKAAGASWDMIVPGKNGYIVNSANVNELYYSIKKIIVNQDVCLKMGEESSKIIQNRFSVHDMVNGFVLAIEHALSSNIS